MNEDLSVFFAEYAVTCLANAYPFKAIENKGDQLTGFEEADQITNGHTITAPTVDFSAAGLLTTGAVVAVGVVIVDGFVVDPGTDFKVRYPLKGGDGALTRLQLGPI